MKRIGLKLILIFMSLTMGLYGCGAESTAVDIEGTEVIPEAPYLEEILIQEHELAVEGLESEFALFFMADTHISLCDDRDPEVMEKAASRYEMFRSKEGVGAEESFQDMIEYISEEEPDLLILGGDILDSAMWASIDHVTKILQEQDYPWIYEMGNHDFEYGKDYFSEKCYKEYLPRLEHISKTQEGWQKIEYEDFIIFAVDDQNNQVSDGALKALEEIYDSGKSIILILHVPIEPLKDNGLWEKSNEVWGATSDGRSRVLLGSRSCLPNETTGRFLDLVRAEESPVELVLAGHVHFYHEGNLTEDTRQIVTGAGFEREIVKVTLVPEIKQ